MILALLVAALPALYWDQPATTAEDLRRAGIETLRVPPERVLEWRQSGLDATPLSPAERARRTALKAPGIAARADWASATRRPWIDANGWRYLRGPNAAYFLAAPPGAAVLAAVEAFAHDADLVLQADPADLEALARRSPSCAGCPRRPCRASPTWPWSTTAASARAS